MRCVATLPASSYGRAVTDEDALDDRLIAEGFEARPDLRHRFEVLLDRCRALGFAGLLDPETQALWAEAERVLIRVRTAGLEALR